MNLNALRSLRGQLLATGGLFVICLPVAIAAVWMLPKFEEHMVERYTIGYAQLDEKLKSLSDAADCGLTELSQSDDITDDERLARVEACAEIACQTPPQMDALYQDCMQRQKLVRARMFRSFVASAPDYFLARAEQTVVCGSNEQRDVALELLEFSSQPQARAKLERLKKWAAARRIPDLPEKIASVLVRLDRAK